MDNYENLGNPFNIQEMKNSLEELLEKPKRKPIVFDLNDTEDATMAAASPKGEPKKYTKHIYYNSLKRFTRSSLMELLDDHEKDTGEEILKKLEWMERKHKVRKFNSAPYHSSARKSWKYGANVSSEENRRKNQIESFSIKVDENGEREISSKIFYKSDNY